MMFANIQQVVDIQRKGIGIYHTFTIFFCFNCYVLNINNFLTIKRNTFQVKTVKRVKVNLDLFKTYCNTRFRIFHSPHPNLTQSKVLISVFTTSLSDYIVILYIVTLIALCEIIHNTSINLNKLNPLVNR